MTKEKVIELMRSSKDKEEWNKNLDAVKAANGGSYPDFWYEEIVTSGLADEVMGSGATDIKISAV